MSTPQLSASPLRKFTFTLPNNQTGTVCAQRGDVADRIDTSHDGYLSDDELKAYMTKQGILKDPRRCAVDVPGVMNQFKSYLQGKDVSRLQGYHSYQQMADEMKSMATQYPGLCQLVSLGKSYEGRDIWALKISKNAAGDTSQRPGVVFTGVHHAREWMTIETPLALAHQLLDGYATDPSIQKRVDSAETWVVPCVNPDGYEYTRNSDAMWRKNRAPVDDSACSAGPIAAPVSTGSNITYGVDPNRNYDDGDPRHEVLYRPTSDKPCRTDDDFGETSDDPNSEVFRGLQGGDQNEIKAMLGLELGHGNIIGVIDHHSYGNDILHPWGHTQDAPANLAELMDCGNQISKAMDQPYTLESSDDMYPTSGDSTDCLTGTGIMAYTIEMGDSFQPDPSLIPSMSQNVNKADMAFLDWIIQHKTGVTRQPLASIPPFTMASAQGGAPIGWD